MTDDKFKVCVEIIRKCRDLDNFTNTDVALRCGNSERYIRSYTNHMVLIGCLVKVGSIKNRSGYPTPLFSVSPNAVTKLYQHQRDTRCEPEPPVIIQPEAKPKRIEFCGTVVDKAYFEPGFGRSFINHIDTMLREVRA